MGALFPALPFALVEDDRRLFPPAFAVSGLHASFLGAPALAWHLGPYGRRLDALADRG